MICLFSGRPNPQFEINDDALKQLCDLVRDTQGKETIHAPPESEEDYYGITVYATREVAAKAKIPEGFRVYRKVLSIDNPRQPEHWRDVAKIEEFLIQQAYKAGYGSLLEYFGIKLPPSEGR